MPNVTVQSAHGSTVTLAYDSSANAALATYVSNAIKAGITGGSVNPEDSATEVPLPLFGKTGEWVQDTTGVVTIPKGFDYIVNVAPFATIIDNNTDAHQAVLTGSGNLILDTSGAGSIIGGGGNNQIIIPVADTIAGGWYVTMGNGNDTIKALSSGSSTISVGSGADSISLGSGNSAVTTGGSVTITAAAGNETVKGFGSDVIYGMGSRLSFAAGGGATVFGGTGSDTVLGGSGPDYFQGGSAGNNSLTAGTGAATLLGGGGGDQLFANGSGAQILFAGSGNETLTGSSVGGASDTFVGSAGTTSVLANPSDSNLFEFVNGSAAGTMNVAGLTSIEQVDIHLAGYASNDLGSVASQNNTGGSLNITLTDGTQITFQNVTQPLTNSNFS